MIRTPFHYSILLFIAGVFFTGFLQHKGKTSSRQVPDPDIFQHLQDREKAIDRYATLHYNMEISLANLPDSPYWTIFTLGHLPEKTIVWYGLLRDSAGRAIRLSEQPQSGTGNWLQHVVYYFDGEGKTFARVLDIDGFDPDDEPDFGLLHQVTVDYYDLDFRHVGQVFTPTSRRSQRLINDSCTLYFGKDTVYSSLPDYLRAHGFPDLSSLH